MKFLRLILLEINVVSDRQKGDANRRLLQSGFNRFADAEHGGLVGLRVLIEFGIRLPCHRGGDLAARRTTPVGVVRGAGVDDDPADANFGGVKFLLHGDHPGRSQDGASGGVHRKAVVVGVTRDDSENCAEGDRDLFGRHSALLCRMKRRL